MDTVYSFQGRGYSPAMLVEHCLAERLPQNAIGPDCMNDRFAVLSGTLAHVSILKMNTEFARELNMGI